MQTARVGSGDAGVANAGVGNGFGLGLVYELMLWAPRLDT